MSGHAKLSPSSAYRWSTCTASPGQEAGQGDSSNPASRSGTADHLVSSECLEHGRDPDAYLGRTLLFWEHTDKTSRGESWDEPAVREQFVGSGIDVLYEVVIDEDSAARCAAYVKFVRDLVVMTNATLMVEQRVPISQITGEAGATGTSDAVLLADDEIVVIDAKFGSGKVNAYEVVGMGADAAPVLQPNKQLSMYSHGTLTEYAWMGEFKRIRMIIVQPRLNHVSEFRMSVEALEAFVATLRAAAEETRSNPTFRPSSDNCFFCKGRLTCQAREQAVLETTLGMFDDLDAIAAAPAVHVDTTRLGVLYDKLGLIEGWCSDLRTRALGELAMGRPVVRADGVPYKLVEGRRGRRAWADADNAEAMLKKFRLRDRDMYDMTLISPTTAEKLATPKVKKGEPPAEPLIGKRQWTRLTALIQQPEGKPEIALLTDKRPALASGDDFEVLDPKPAAAVPADTDLFN